MKRLDELLRIVQECGAQRAVMVRREDILCDAVFRDICAGNACGNYGRCWMCPPHIGPIDQLMADVQAHAFGVMYQNVYDIEDSFDIEGMLDAGKAHHACSSRIHEKLCGGELHLTAGGCGVCEICAQRNGEACRFPDKAISSLEGYGVNVHGTAQNVGLKYINGQNTVTYFGMILLKENADA